MTGMTLEELAGKMKGIDFAMLNTMTDGGELAGRPMSNNGDVDYDGDSWFFAYDSARSVTDIDRDPRVSLSFYEGTGLLGKPGIFVAVEGRGELIRDRAVMEQHWQASLGRWFPDGIDTRGIVLIKVHATRIHYWDGTEEGEVPLAA